MRFTSFGLVSLLISGALAFRNASPLIVQSDKLIKEFTYVTKEETYPFCQVFQKSKNIVLQIPNLTHEDLVLGLEDLPQVGALIKSEELKFTPFYKYVEKIDNDDRFNCTGLETTFVEIDTLNEEKFIDGLQDLQLSDEKEILVYKMPALNKDYNVKRVELNQLDNLIDYIVTLVLSNDKFSLTIQGIPERVVDEYQFLNSVEKLLHHRRKREETIEKYKQEVEEIFKESDNIDNVFTLENLGGLLERYQFFSPGLWMATIVSFFLLSILIILFQWLNSLQISYKSFDKQVSPQRKNQ